MDSRKIRNGAAWGLSILLALAFAAAAVPKLLGAPAWIAKFAGWGYPQWFMYLIGTVEMLGGVLLLIPRVAIYGVGLLGIEMLGASYTHLANHEGLQVLRPLLFLVLFAVVVWLRRWNPTQA